MSLKMYQETPKIKHTIAVAAGKGGVGKSTITVNLAFALKALGYSVGILDVDVYGPSIRHMLPVGDLPKQEGEKIIPGEGGGIKFISIAHFRKQTEAVAVRAPIANGIITQFLRQVDWGALDFLLLDFPPGTGDVQMTLCQNLKLTGAVMVTTPQEVAVLDVKKAMHLFDQLKVPVIGVVENMSYFLNPASGEKERLFGIGGGRKLAEKCPLLGEVPLEPVVGRCLDEGRSIFLEEEEISKPYLLLAKEMLLAIETQELPQSARRLFQKDNKTLSIEWGDGEISHFPLAELQKECPCAGCAEQTPKVEEDVEVVAIIPVGRYALRLQFTSGCSTGIYELERLRDLVLS